MNRAQCFHSLPRVLLATPTGDSAAEVAEELGTHDAKDVTEKIGEYWSKLSDADKQVHAHQRCCARSDCRVAI